MNGFKTGWIPDDATVELFFTNGVGDAYSLTADPDLRFPVLLWDRWLAEHDRQVAEKAYDEGKQAVFEAMGKFSKLSDVSHSNPYWKEESC